MVKQMNETYVEWLVKKKTPAWMTLLKIPSMMLAGCFILIGFVFFPAFLVGIALGIGAYIVYLNADLEYEYLYLDKELAVDKIMAKTRRKRVVSYQLDRIEILAPIKSYRLDNYRKRQAKVKDYSIGEELQPDRRYLMFYEGGEKIVLSPSEELIKVMKNAAPRKVFSD